LDALRVAIGEPIEVRLLRRCGKSFQHALRSSPGMNA
jgi:hypothetical protein